MSVQCEHRWPLKLLCSRLGIDWAVIEKFDEFVIKNRFVLDGSIWFSELLLICQIHQTLFPPNFPLIQCIVDELQKLKHSCILHDL